MDGDDLREIAGDVISSSRSMAGYLAGHGFAVYDVSTERERVLGQIVEDIKKETRRPVAKARNAE
jgi:hypothetical protein